jgi:hypothetical protein
MHMNGSATMAGERRQLNRTTTIPKPLSLSLYAEEGREKKKRYGEIIKEIVVNKGNSDYKSLISIKVIVMRHTT